MSNDSGLAAVHEAAGMISKSDHEKALAAAREEGRKAGLEEGSTIKVEETKTLTARAREMERERIAGIEAHALPGHEKLIAEMKANPAVTPDMAAGRILAAEKKVRDDQMAGIRKVEDETGKVGADSTSQRRDTAGATGPKVGEQKTKEAYMADWEKSPELKADFASAESYANYAAGVASGRIRVLKKA